MSQRAPLLTSIHMWCNFEPKMVQLDMPSHSLISLISAVSICAIKSTLPGAGTSSFFTLTNRIIFWFYELINYLAKPLKRTLKWARKNWMKTDCHESRSQLRFLFFIGLTVLNTCLTLSTYSVYTLDEFTRPGKSVATKSVNKQSTNAHPF